MPELPDLAVFYAMLRAALIKAHDDNAIAFRDQFNNGRQHRTSRNRKPRTDMMLGCSANGRVGIVPEAIRQFLGQQVQPSYERYLDCIVYEGCWGKGECLTRLIVEVENETREFEGTLSDLLRYQARQKIGIFYDDDARSDQTHWEKRMRSAFDIFVNAGFRESGSTEYLIVFGPSELKAAGIGEWCGMLFANSSRNSPTWV
jgi:hypothetical protein